MLEALQRESSRALTLDFFFWLLDYFSQARVFMSSEHMNVKV